MKNKKMSTALRIILSFCALFAFGGFYAIALMELDDVLSRVVSGWRAKIQRKEST